MKASQVKFDFLVNRRFLLYIVLEFSFIVYSVTMQVYNNNNITTNIDVEISNCKTISLKGL